MLYQNFSNARYSPASRRQWLAQAGSGFGALALNSLLMPNSSANETQISSPFLLKCRTTSPRLNPLSSFSWKVAPARWIYSIPNPCSTNLLVNPSPIALVMSSLPWAKVGRHSWAAQEFGNSMAKRALGLPNLSLIPQIF